MFSFHKPRVYRSAEGCCICRAKSSSSRFTDSRKYEHDSMKCFDLKYPRHGEICNACVLLVKRFKRLPTGSTRHWGHVVDARAGPGTKSITKNKKGRDDSGENSPNINNSNGSSSTSRRTQNSKSLTEKFSKIFKKSKNKIISGSASSSTPKNESVGKRRSSGLSTQSWKDQPHLLPTTVDSMDSDYEDNGGRSCLTSNGSVVQFQTQTRASSYRSRNRISNVICRDVTLACIRNPKKTGSKRRKCMPPVRNRRTLELFNENVQFFDESEWKERKSCCGMVYECQSLSGTLLIDVKNFKACPEHQQSLQNNLISSQPQLRVEPESTVQKLIFATVPPVQQSCPSASTTSSVNAQSLPVPISVTANVNPTPVLKKHHLFFKRQSECFPHGDLNITSGVKSNVNPMTKTETFATITVNSNKSNNSSISVTTIENTAINVNCLTNVTSSVSLPLSINTSSNVTPICSNNSPAIPAVQMPRHPSAKITTISSPPTTSYGNKLIHKIKTGKVYKHSTATGVGTSVGATAAERINKNIDGHDLKHIVRTMPKSYVLTRPSNNNNPGFPQLTSTTLHYPVGSSPTSTCSNSSSVSLSSAAPKFSDNSSDSGFDENMQERKSASPLQEDTEKKLATRAPMGNVHTMFLASGVQVQGQQQNLMLAGNEVAAKLLQNRRQQMAVVTANNVSMSSSNNILQHYQQQANNNTRLNASTSALKIAQAVGPGGSSAPSAATISIGAASNMMSGPHCKPSRAIYNNNTIQHENGVTTIVPASSLAASTQTAAMNALAPSTVTITPAPTHITGAATLTKKFAASNATLIATSNNNNCNILHSVSNGVTHLNTVNAHSNSLLQHQQQSHHNANSALNQKIILVKTTGATKYNNNLNSSSSKTVAMGAIPGIGVSATISANGGTGACKN